MKLHLKHFLLLWVTFFSLTLMSCQNEASTSTPAATQTPPTARPTPTSTPEPLGEPGNPLVMGIGGVESQPAQQAADEIARIIAEQTGYSIRSQLYLSYQDLIEDMRNGRVHFAWLPPITYLYANEYGFADARMITNHFGVYEYGIQYLANANSGYQVYFDPSQGQNISEASAALVQFSGKTPCLTDPDSVSGYLVPLALLTQNNIPWNEPLYLRSYTSIVRALYITGICDYGVTFAISGDPRTSSAVQQDLTDAIQRVPIIWRSDPIIPNLGLAFLPEIPSIMQTNIEFALQDLANDPNGRKLLSDANNYEIQDLKSIDDQFYQPFRELMALTNRDLRELIGK